MKNGELYRLYQESGLTETEFWRANKDWLIKAGIHSYDSLHGRLWRAQQTGIPDNSPVFDVEMPPFFVLEEGQYGVCGDIHVTSADYGWLGLFLAMSKKYLKKPRVCILAGDLYNHEASSPHPLDTAPTPLYSEIKASQIVIQEIMRVYDRVIFLLGNHDRWISKKTKGVVSPEILKDWASPNDDRLTLSYREYCRVKNTAGNGHDWLVLHGEGAYSQQPTASAREYALLEHANVISHHEHHFGATYDKSGRYMAISNGGLFNPETIQYYQQRISKKPRMVQGFTLLDYGYPLMFGPEPWTNWAKELPLKKVVA